MPVVAADYMNQKAGGAFENAAEEILNGLFCHYEPPASTKAQKNAADKVRSGDPTEILYQEQQNKLVAKKFKKEKQETEDERSDGEEEGEETEETQEEREAEEPETPKKDAKGVKWRDEESKKKSQEEAEKSGLATAFLRAQTQCGTMVGDWGVCGSNEKDIPQGLEDVQDEMSVVRQPETPGTLTPKSVLKNSGETPKVLYDDEGNPMNAKRSPSGSVVRNSPFFRSQSPISALRASPKHFDGRPDVYEPNDYNKSPSNFRMNRKSTPRPDKNAQDNEKEKDEQEEFVERLAKLPTRTSPRVGRVRPSQLNSSKAPRHFDGRVGGGKAAYGSVVDELVKKFQAQKFAQYNPAKSPSARSEFSDITMNDVPDDNRGPSDAEQQQADGNKPQYVGTRLVKAPEAPKSPAKKWTKAKPIIVTNVPHIDRNRDPTPRKMRPEDGRQSIQDRILPPTPRKVETAKQEEELREIKNTGIVKKQLQESNPSPPAPVPVEESNGDEPNENTQPNKQKSSKKKGLLSGMKKTLKKVKNVVNDIDESRVAVPKSQKKKK